MEPKIMKGRFGGDELTVAILASDIQGSLELMKRNGINNIAINSEWGWRESRKNTDFLRDNPWIEGLTIVEDGIDVGPINELHHLKRLRLPDLFSGTLDFHNFPELEMLNCRWNKKQLKNLGDAVSLQEASIAWINEVDLSLLSKFRNLKRFNTIFSKIQSLHGIENWNSLESISLENLPRLSDLTALEKLGDHLKNFFTSGCKSLTDYSFLEKQKALETFTIGDNPALPSVEFIKNLNVKSCHIGARILDNNVKLLEERGFTYYKYKSYK